MQPVSHSLIPSIMVLVNYEGFESISALTVSFHSMILTSSACVRKHSDRAEIAAGSSSWNLTEDGDDVIKIYIIYKCICSDEKQ